MDKLDIPPSGLRDDAGMCDFSSAISCGKEDYIPFFEFISANFFSNLDLLSRGPG